MATTPKTICFFCEKLKVAYLCPGCSKDFCFDHLSEHRKTIEQEFDQLENYHDLIRQQINDLKINSNIEQIDQWEKDSINQIQQQAQRCRTQWIDYSNSYIRQMEKKLNHLAEQIKRIHQENAFNEVDLNDLKKALEKLQKKLEQPKDVEIKQQSTSFINKILISSSSDIRWQQFASIIAGGNGQGNRLDQLNLPGGIAVDDQNQMIYIADFSNHRIVEWSLDTNNGRIVAGGNGAGDRLDQLNEPSHVIIDRQNNDLIIADSGNRRVLRWSRQSNSSPQIIIDDIHCCCLAMHKDGSIYVSNWNNDEVTRWEKGKKRGKIVAGRCGEGDELHQFNNPGYLFINDDYTLYISDRNNDRVVKWVKGAKEGVVVAGGNGRGNQLTQLASPGGIIVDQFGQIYVADMENDRVMRWCEGQNEGKIVVGGNGQGQGKNQLYAPIGLSFDGEENLYVADDMNHRIVKFQRNFDF